MNEPVRWTEVRVLAPEGWTEFVAQRLAALTVGGAAFGPPSLGTEPPPEGFDFVRAFIPDRLDTPGLRSAIEVELGGLGQATGAQELDDLRAEFRELPPEDYANSWRKTWKPFRVGRLCVLPPGDERELREGDLRLVLEPGGAFGSGRHVTTRECLRAAQERTIPGQRILDAGSGSGILAVACVLLGAGEAQGFDLDPNARPYAEALARDNAVADRCRFATGGFEVLGDATESFDGVLANIYADVLCAELPGIERSLRPGGWFALSGCESRHAPRVLSSLSRCNLLLDEMRIRGRWHTFVGSRPIGSSRCNLSGTRG
ncbi:MAG: 50S ribosomal protein L11 methyltransferase [Planctomycetota bacterium]